MNIAIDASRASKKQRTGTENYSRSLIFNMAKIDTKNKYTLYVGPDYDGCFGNLPKNFSVKIINRKKYWTQIGLSLEMLKTKPDVLFVPSHLLPPICPKKSVVVIHDVAFKHFPEAYSNDEIKLQNLAVKRAIKKQAKIVVYSKSTAIDLQKFYSIDPSQITFVPMGFDFKGHCEEERRSNPSIKKGYFASLTISENDDFILSVGRLEKRKNTANIIKAYKLLRKERKIKHKLVLAGKQGFGFEEIQNEIETAGNIKNDIIQTGYVDDEILHALYKHASILVFPSLAEGFGIPILEAFAAETPVITSNISSMPEVAGNAAILVDPKKPFEIAAGISQILNKPNLRDDLITKGKKRLNEFSWEKTANEMIKVLSRTDN